MTELRRPESLDDAEAERRAAIAALFRANEHLAEARANAIEARRAAAYYSHWYQQLVRKTFPMPDDMCVCGHPRSEHNMPDHPDYDPYLVTSACFAQLAGRNDFDECRKFEPKA